MATDMHIIIKKKGTFDVYDYPYGTTLALSGTVYAVNYYSDAAHTGSVQIATYQVADYLAYVVPNE